MDTFFENAHRIFNTASAGSDSATGGFQDFAVLVRADGGLHFVMETPFTLEGAAQAEGAQTVYRVSRSGAGVRVEGREAGLRCLMETKPAAIKHKGAGFPGTHSSAGLAFLKDAPCYRISSPVLISGSVETGFSVLAPSMRWE